VVPAQFEQQVADLARQQDAMDAFSLQKIREGLPLSQAFPLNAELRAEFDRSRA
jgi:hypothetical protein